ncbi:MULTISPECIES: GntR family transcriptional regulator [unclassified Methylobacterium]|uniref:GntR family transcriptional regulator n=1 Tax=unclassified Methylobacterium TaxID=2615210 RepID=UPI001FBA35B2|nr:MULTISPECIES: GntR family transcriptional regulator [unclassified Methylobacterium]MCJ2118405.1 GntR family transcriptional regulator [Methylobacterium sp. J-001]
MLDCKDRTNPLATEENLRERVERQLRLDILAGTIEPGTVFSVPSLSRSLGISTTPVREALLQLAADDLLQPIRNRGFRVVDPTLDELRNLFEVRVQLEAQAFAKVVRAGAVDVNDLMKWADEIARAVRDRDVPAYLVADRSFHEALLSRAGNPILTGIVMKLRDKMRLYGIRSKAGRTRQDASVAEHYRIVDLVTGRVKDDAMTLMTDHIMAWEPVFTEAVLMRRIN